MGISDEVQEPGGCHSAGDQLRGIGLLAASPTAAEAATAVAWSTELGVALVEMEDLHILCMFCCP